MTKNRKYLHLFFYFICSSYAFSNEALINSIMERSVLCEEGLVEYKQEEWKLDGSFKEKIVLFDENTLFENEVLNFDLKNKKVTEIDKTIIFNKNGYKIVNEFSTAYMRPERLEQYSFDKDKLKRVSSNMLGILSTYDELTKAAIITPESPLKLPVREICDLDPTICDLKNILNDEPERTLNFFEEKNKIKLESSYKRGGELLTFVDSRLVSYISKSHDDDGEVKLSILRYYTNYKQMSDQDVPTEIWSVGYNKNRETVHLIKFTVKNWDLKPIENDQLSIEIPTNEEVE